VIFIRDGPAGRSKPTGKPLQCVRQWPSAKAAALPQWGPIKATRLGGCPLRGRNVSGDSSRTHKGVSGWRGESSVP